jgi:hypothetical protein
MKVAKDSVPYRMLSLTMINKKSPVFKLRFTPPTNAASSIFGCDFGHNQASGSDSVCWPFLFVGSNLHMTKLPVVLHNREFELQRRALLPRYARVLSRLKQVDQSFLHKECLQDLHQYRVPCKLISKPQHVDRFS